MTGFAFGNGRLEADVIDIDTKFAGRIAQLLADEGDIVRAGQVVAVMDTRDLHAHLEKSQAAAAQAERVLDEARINLTQQDIQRSSSQAAAVQAEHALNEAQATLRQLQAQLELATNEYGRTRFLVPRGAATVQELDQRQHAMAGTMAARDAAAAKVGQAQQTLVVARYNADSAVAARAAAAARVGQAEHALEAAARDVDYYRVEIADNSLAAPREGPIEYRLASVGEVLPAGGKVFTMLDGSYVYMDIYLPTAEAGRVKLGTEARIQLDAYPGRAVPASVVFVASRAQFTPKAVETKDERDKLTFRVRARVDQEWLKDRLAAVRSGLPGVAYVRIDPDAAWPARLQPVSAPPPPAGTSAATPP